jgi:hypothetical protein
MSATRAQPNFGSSNQINIAPSDKKFQQFNRHTEKGGAEIKLRALSELIDKKRE